MSVPLSNDPTTVNGHTIPTKYPLPEAQYQEISGNPDVFLEKLQSFHTAFGTKFKVPTLGGKAVDLHRLFVEVTSRGGIEKVVRDRKWKEVIAVFNFPPTITSASFVLRKYYQSLLYHFEQVYYLRKKVPSILAADSASRIVNGSASLHDNMHGAVKNQFSASPNSEAGSIVTGAIDGKFDNGYLITVNMGSEMLKGVLYHIPMSLQVSGSYTSTAPSHGNHKRYQLALRDPSPPEANRSGYDIFFAEHYASLKPLYAGQENAIGKKIELLWGTLSEEERQVYQEKGSRDEER